MSQFRFLRPLAGLSLVVAIVAVVAIALSLFNDSYNDDLTFTVLAPRAGLVMNPDAKVKLHGAQIGQVKRIDSRDDGTASIEVGLDRGFVDLVPSNVLVEIASSTVFGAKSIELIEPNDPSAARISPGQVIDARHVMVEINTVFERLSELFNELRPDQLNDILSALGSALSGRGNKIAQTLTSLNTFLSVTEPALPALSDSIADAPAVLAAYADAAPDLVGLLSNVTQISDTIVSERDNLDALLLASTGLAHVGADVLEHNGQPLEEVLRLMVPTTDLTNEYNAALTCQLKAMIVMFNATPPKNPGVETLAGLTFGVERYRFPGDLPKVAALGGPQCGDLPLPFEGRPRYVVADTGSNPFKYMNQGIMLNSAGLKEFLFGHIDGPPRNTADIGHPG